MNAAMIPADLCASIKGMLRAPNATVHWSEVVQQRHFTAHHDGNPVIIYASQIAAHLVDRLHITVAAGCTATVIYVQDAPFEHELCTIINIDAHASSRTTFHSIASGASWHVQQIEVHLHAADAVVEIKALTLVGDQQHHALFTRQYHHAAHTESTVLAKAIVADQARTVYSGLIAIEKEGMYTKAYQHNRNLLWHTSAKSWSIPALEVKANQVKCVHGSASGPLDSQQLLYARSRGLSQEQATRLLLGAFIAEILPKQLAGGLLLHNEPILTALMKRLYKE